MSTQEAVRHVEGEVRELIRRSGIDPTSNTLEVRRLVQDAVQDYDERSLHGGLPSLGDMRSAVHSILAVVAGYGPLQQYFDDPAVEEIWVNEPVVFLILPVTVLFAIYPGVSFLRFQL
jgi:pilus assembly protein CpaF